MLISEDKLAHIYAAYLDGEQPAMPIYKKVYHAFRSAILNNDLPANCVMPSTRKLATSLHLSRSTVIKAYELLCVEGLLSSKSGAGHVITYANAAKNAKTSATNSRQFPSLSKMAQAFERNKDLVNTLDDNTISFRPGLPALDVFPIHQWKQLTNRHWQLITASELTYHNPVGMDALRISLVNYLNISRGIKCTVDQVFIVGGSLQSLFLIGSLVLDPNDTVALEEHSFPNVHSLFTGLRSRIIPAKVDEEGMTVEPIKSNRKVKLVHTTPACQYPTGVQMSAARRLALLKTVSAKRAYLIENDYEHEINDSVNPQKPLFTLDQEDRTFYIGTFNRILHPSIRLGYMIVPKHLTEPMKNLMRHSHMFLAPAIQLTMRNFIEHRFFHNHISKLLKVIENRKQHFEKALSDLKNPYCKPKFLSMPSLHMLVGLHPDISDSKLVERLKQKGVITHALSKCAVGNTALNGLIIGYASTREQHMKAKLKTLIIELNKA